MMMIIKMLCIHMCTYIHGCIHLDGKLYNTVTGAGANPKVELPPNAQPGLSLSLTLD